MPKLIFKRGLRFKKYHKQEDCPFGKCEACSCIVCGEKIPHDRKSTDPLCKVHARTKLPPNPFGPIKRKAKPKQQMTSTSSHDTIPTSKKRKRTTCTKHTPDWKIEDFDMNIKTNSSVDCCVCRNESFKIVPNVYYKKAKEKEKPIPLWLGDATW